MHSSDSGFAKGTEGSPQQTIENSELSRKQRELEERIGEIDNSNLTVAQKSRLKSLEHTIVDHLTEGDFSGTLRDLNGDPVPNGHGGFFDHQGEMKDSYRALKKIERALSGSLNNPNLPEYEKSLLQSGLERARKNIKRIEGLFEPYGGIANE